MQQAPIRHAVTVIAVARSHIIRRVSRVLMSTVLDTNVLTGRAAKRAHFRSFLHISVNLH